MKTRSIKSELKRIKGKKVFLRVDFNVPIKKGRIKEEAKILAALPTIRFLLRYNCRIILATHLGDPSGKKKADLSVLPLAKRLGQILGRGAKAVKIKDKSKGLPRFGRVKFVGEAVGRKAEAAAADLASGEILFLENLRFDKGEEANDKNFAKGLARLADVYVNDAFSVCHREHASVKAIKKYLPSFSGLLLEQEISNLDKIKNPAKPLAVLMGGAKIKTKINLIKNLDKKASHILIGGALANNFFKAKGLPVGQSLIDKESVAIAKKLLSNKKIILPIDVVVQKKTGGKSSAAVKLVEKVSKDEAILDIGPQTIKRYAQILKEAKTIVWNGPLGFFEDEHFRHGTLALGQVIASRSRGQTFGVVGGGETLEVLKMTKMEGYIDWVSMGGGAMLAYLGGEKMPGLS